jgi:L-fucose isomerase-like protein
MSPATGEVVKLPAQVSDQWWNSTTPVWPFMAAALGMSRDTLMAHYMSNHIAVAYGDIFQEMAALSQELGFKVRIISQANQP